MKKHEMINLIEKLNEESGAGILATVGNDGTPRMRWMTPTTLKGRPGVLFAITAPGTAKREDLDKQPVVEWMFQSKTLNEVLKVRGTVNVLDNPALKSEIIQSLGRKLHVFWKINHEADFVVLETIIEEATYMKPLSGIKETVKFQ